MRFTLITEQLKDIEMLSSSPAYVALVVMALGMLWLVWGYDFYRYLVTMLFALAGVILGYKWGQSFGYAHITAVAVGGVFALVAWPLVRWSTAVACGYGGWVVGVAVWQLCGQAESYSWAGGAIGFVFLAMLTFIIFKPAVILWASIQGTQLFLSGLLASLLIWPISRTQTQQIMYHHAQWILALAVLIIGASFYWQAKQHGLGQSEGAESGHGSRKKA
jgi:hypothetical protein